MSAAAAVAVVLKPNSIPHEYYLGDLPGSLQYKKTVAELTSVANIDTVDSDCGYVECTEFDPRMVRQFVPDTATGRAGDWELLLVFEAKGKKDGEVWRKAAMRDRRTGHIALMTATNAEEHITCHGNRALKSLADGWWVGFYRMGAPMVFWRRVAEVVAKRT